MSISSLDNPQFFRQYDTDGMLSRLSEMPEQCQRAWNTAMNFELPSSFSGVNKIIILGMGASAIGGDLVSSLALSESKVPVFVSRDYSLPVFVDDKTLVIGSSYSGMTEETLTAFEQSMEKKAKKLAITTGGKLKEMAEKRNIPVFNIDYKSQPRAALAFSFLPVLCFLQKLGFLRDRSADIAEMVKTLKELTRKIGESAPSSENQAKQLAQKLYGRLAVVYGGGIVSEVAHRWKTQLNENGKAWAFYEIFPELNHNAVVGYQFPVELASKIMVVMLKSTCLSGRVQLRYQITARLLEQAKVAYHIVEGSGASQLSQMMSLILFGDYVSCYLAILNGIDPSPVEVIAYLKEQLAQAKGT